HVAAVQLDDVPDEREPETEATDPSRGRAVRLLEAIEHVREKARIDAGAGIGHAEDDVRPLLPDLDPNATVRPGEFHRVREQVPDHLLQALGIRNERAELAPRIELELDAFGLCRGTNDVHGVARDGDEIGGFALELELARDDPGDIEDVFDDLRLRLGISVNDVDPLR